MSGSGWASQSIPDPSLAGVKFQIIGRRSISRGCCSMKRVMVDLRHARAEGKRLSADRELFVDATRIASLRVSGASWSTISQKLSVESRHSL